MYRIEFTSKATKQLRQLPAQVRRLVEQKLVRLAKNPLNAAEVKALQGEAAYRLRVGDYRVVYTLDHGVLLITVIRIAHRKEVYR